MRISLPLALGLSALAGTLAAKPASAGSSRSATLSLTCDGTIQHQDFAASGFPASTDQFILGSEATVADTKRRLISLVLRAEASEQKQLMTLGPGATHAAFALPTFFKVTADSSGDVSIGVDAACRKGPSLTAIFTIIFN